MKKRRLDNYLFEKGFSESIDKARKEIITGWVKIDGETIRDPARKIANCEKIQIARPGGDFVSRGGDKLQHALKIFKISVKNKTIADIGSSTGGFTDCLLQNGARRVYSIDVGYGILAYSLRTDSRVIVKERTNVRNLTKNDFGDIIDFITIDLSFVSILELFDHIMEIFSPVQGIILIKPQFEANQHEHDKGLVKEKQFHIDILDRVLHTLNAKGLEFKGLCFSPVKGHAGNIEFLLFFAINRNEKIKSLKIAGQIIETVVNEAHDKL